jgi:hypothetical protein
MMPNPRLAYAFAYYSFPIWLIASLRELREFVKDSIILGGCRPRILSVIKSVGWEGENENRASLGLTACKTEPQSATISKEHTKVSALGSYVTSWSVGICCLAIIFSKLLKFPGFHGYTILSKFTNCA